MSSNVKKLVALGLSLIMALGLVVFLAPETTEANPIPQANRAVAFPIIGLTSAATYRSNWGGAGVGVGDGYEIVFDVTQEGRHTISFVLNPTSRLDLWHQGSAIKLFMPTNPTGDALPVFIESISIGGEVKMRNRAFAANGRFWYDGTPRRVADVVNLPNGPVHNGIQNGVPFISDQNLALHAFYLPVGYWDENGQPVYVHINHANVWYAAAYPSEILGAIPSGGPAASRTMEIVIRVGELIVEGNFGDVNDDDVINAVDASILRRYLDGQDPPGFVRRNAFIAGNDAITLADLTRLRLHLAATDPRTVPLGPPRELERWPAPPPRPAWAAERVAEFSDSTRLIALTFDDGPQPIWTAMILNFLRDCPYGPHTATFYVNPIKINDATIHLIHRMVAEGHDVAHHGWDHTSFGGHDAGLGRHDANSARRDFEQASWAIFEATGYWPWSFRAPFLEWSLANPLLSIFHMANSGLTIDTGDVALNTPGGRTAIANRVITSGARNNMNALFHDDGGGTRLETAMAVPIILNALAPQGYEFVTVRELHEVRRRPVGRPNWWVNWHSDNNPWANPIPPWLRTFG